MIKKYQAADKNIKNKKEKLVKNLQLNYYEIANYQFFILPKNEVKKYLKYFLKKY